jgi:cytochrome c biogenesis protein CcdA/thiol-disulfide isomerase/thioredoxin
VGIVVGLELSFFLIGIVLAGALGALGLPHRLLQWVGAGLLVAFALTMLLPSLHERFQAAVSKATAPLAEDVPRRAGFVGGFLAGAPLGLIWAPCAGPILAGITVAGATTSFSGRAVATMVAYGLGMLGPLLAIGFGGRRLSDFLRARLGGGRRVELGMAAVLLLTAAMVGFGWVNTVNRFLAERIGLSSTPTEALEQRALAAGRAVDAGGGERVRLSEDELRFNGYPELEELADYGPAPEVAGISDWFNSDPLTISELRGKVVLVDFWTYSCINCIRTFPYLRQWYADYADDGLVILGVHTPEFAFEKEPRNVAAAIEDFDIEYPVALDPDYATWESYYNHYWPAHYLIDRDGVLRSVHYGEGAYERTENEIRHLLSLPASGAAGDEVVNLSPRTPETYLGYARADRFAGAVDGRFGFVPDEPAEYEAPAELPLDSWTYEGTWTVGEENAVAGPAAELQLHYLGREVHIVAGPGSGDGGTLTVSEDGASETIEIDGHRLYTLRSGEHRQGVIRLRFSEGVEVYSFTFG